MSINESPNTTVQQAEKRNGGCLKTLGIMLITIIISIVATIFVINYLTQKKLEPVELSKKEESILNQKLQQFNLPTLTSSNTDNNTDNLTPEPYSEDPEKREIFFTEKELNAMLAKNTDLAEKVAIDLADNLVSAKVLIPLDPDFPFLGGKTLKFKAGAHLAYANERPIVILKGASVWGVPVPNAWLGNLKNVDLVKEFGGDDGFWKSFADGIENISVAEGKLKIKLKE